jgi:pyruvate dehydrogenase E2 component (dihydrolipoyllysine-residue acetyltransferase)
MADLTMPKMGDAMEEGTVLRWLKNEGDEIQEEEPLAEIQTEKATIEVPSYVAGKLTQILVPEGQTVPVGTPIARYEPAGGESNGQEAGPSTAAATADEEHVPGASHPVPMTPGQPNAGGSREPQPAPATGRGYGGAPAGEVIETFAGDATGERVKATPLARKVAAARGIDLAQIHGTGPGGRIVEADVEGALAPSPAAPRSGAAPTARPPVSPSPRPPVSPSPGQIRPLSPMRKTIAKRLTESKQTVPHFYVTMEVDMAAAAQFREQLNSLEKDRPPISYNDLVIKACATALRKFPAVNSQFTGDGILQPEGIHVGVAVALEEGLVVPVVRDADQKSLTAIAGDLAPLIERARAGKLQPAEYSGGTFSISNMGMFGVRNFIAVINPPESAILAIGAVQQRPVVKDGQLAVGTVMEITLSVDHRAVDGAVAAQFLRDVKRLLEKPLLLV